MASTRRRARWTGSLCSIVAAGLTLTACGGTSPGSGGGATTGEPIKIGLAVARTGFASAQASLTAGAAEAWARSVNDHGGIDGRRVEIIAKDSGATPTTAQAVAKELVQSENVVAMMVSDPAAESSIAPYLEQQKVPVIGVLGLDKTSWGVRTNYFSTSTANTTTQQTYATSAIPVGAKSVGVVVCAEAATCQQTAGVVEQTSAAERIAYTGVAKVAASQPNFTAECLSFLGKHTELIALGVSMADTGVRVASDCQKQGYTGSFVVTSLSVIQKYLDKLPGAKFVGSMSSFPWWADTPGAAAFRDAMKKEAPDYDYANAFAPATWTSLELFRKAVTGRTAGLDRQKVMDGYYSLKDETLGGLLPQAVTYTKDKGAPIVRCFWLYTYEGGTQKWTVEQSGRNGNGATGELASSCYDTAPS